MLIAPFVAVVLVVLLRINGGDYLVAFDLWFLQHKDYPVSRRLVYLFPMIDPW